MLKWPRIDPQIVILFPVSCQSLNVFISMRLAFPSKSYDYMYWHVKMISLRAEFSLGYSTENLCFVNSSPYKRR